ncbi:MAG: hypothetical protein JXA37_10195 [Chloroflexia bacterium]|nr:hypothetical protein [Chloroflexia bacterium]
MPQKFIRLPTAPPGSVLGQVRLRCPGCRERVDLEELESRHMVCPWCDWHLPLEARSRRELLLDEGSFVPLDSAPSGPTLFGWAGLRGRPLALVVGDPAASWNAERVRALIELAEESRLQHRPLLWILTAAHGAAGDLPWPGLLAALDQLRRSSLPWLTLLSGPCYGPVTALALQADLVLAEPGTVARPADAPAGRLPREIDRSPRRLLRQGWADQVLPRSEQRQSIAALLDLLNPPGAPSSPPPAPKSAGRHWDRPLQVLEQLCSPFYELQGDRCQEDDAALVGGLGRLREDGQPLLVLVTAQGKGWHEKARRHHGAISAAGWRKATRLLQMAARFELPVLCLVAAPRGRQRCGEPATALSTAMTETLRGLLDLPGPTLSVHLAAPTGLPSWALSATDRLLSTEALAGPLRQAGLSPDVVLPSLQDLLPALSSQLRTLRQTYAVQGPLGRRKLYQHRYAHWTRSPAAMDS